MTESSLASSRGRSPGTILPGRAADSRPAWPVASVGTGEGRTWTPTIASSEIPGVCPDEGHAGTRRDSDFFHQARDDLTGAPEWCILVHHATETVDQKRGEAIGEGRDGPSFGWFSEAGLR